MERESVSRFRVHNSISIFALVIAMFSAGADAAKVKPQACGLGAAQASRFSEDEGTDARALSDFSQAAYDLMKAGKFVQLDCVASSVRSKKERSAGGMWKIHAIYADLGKPPLHPTVEDWRAHMAMVNRWVALRPQSITARIALAESYIEWAQDARGTGFADTVSESGWKLYKQRLAKAKQILDKATALPVKDPEWYVTMQKIALGTFGPEANRDLFARAVKFEPGYYYYYQRYAQSILPKWSKEGETEKFAQESADQIGGDAGDAIYFRIASNLLICNCQDQQGDQWDKDTGKPPRITSQRRNGRAGRVFSPGGGKRRRKRWRQTWVRPRARVPDQGCGENSELGAIMPEGQSASDISPVELP